MRVFLKVLLLTAGIVAGLASCGFEDIEFTKVKKDENSDQNKRKKIQIPIQLLEQNSGFNLAAATGFDVVLEGCVTGLTATADETTVGGLQVYKDDEGCLAKLTQFETGGVTYSASNPRAVDFTTWLAGDTASFTNGAGTLSIGVVVVTQLDNPISGTEPIEYGFFEVQQGTGQQVPDTVVGASHVLTVGSDGAPDVEIEVGSLATSFIGLTATGAGEFVFDLECGSAVSGNDCTGLDMTAWTLALVQDTFAGSPTLAELNALVTAGGQSVNGAIGANGGITTPTLLGPDAMHLNSEMLLVVKNGSSYKYFEVDVTVLQSAQ